MMMRLRGAGSSSGGGGGRRRLHKGCRSGSGGVVDVGHGGRVVDDQHVRRERKG